ncbi:MAG TPA: hypothetical protein PLE19_11975 [Planctomycetota bacterium]|nr:hypothetical protein [Planctomycetota bacterium]HRR81064.1 hypothetical protein [Planctomycetota bacterium]HRT96532.1 hypothetical protein [Planctomycetota bacterium]
MGIAFAPAEASRCWFLHNHQVSLAVDKATGWLRSMAFQPSGVDLFQIRRQNIPGYLGFLRVYDQRDDRWYHDLKDRCRVRAAKRGNKVTLTKRFAGAPFELKVTLALDDFGLLWQAEARKTSRKVADRSLRIGFNLPLQAGWHVWAPCRDGDFVFDGMEDFNFNHIQVSYVSGRDIILPMVSHTSRDLDAGYSMLLPLDARVPMATFQFENGDKGFNWGYAEKPVQSLQTLECLQSYIGLVGDRPARAAVRVLFHGGDWRLGLEQVYRHYRAFFDPDSPEIHDAEGVFLCGGIEVGRDPKAYTALGLKTLEVHGHFSYYSDYFQDGQARWLKINSLERLYHKWRKEGNERDAYQVWAWVNCHTPAEIAAELGAADVESLYHTRADIQAQLTRIAEAGICPFWYFNYTDGFRPVAEARWPDAICRTPQGDPIPSGWHMCHNMNADLSTSFGQFCLESAKKILAEYPQLKGFFLDCFRHYEIDFAHDDGLTVVDNRPAYSVNFSYDELTRRIKEHMKSLGRPLSMFANKPQTLRCMRHVDGVLLEGDGDISEEKYFWACLAKPMFFLWTSDRANTDENLRRCVLHGCFPTIARDGRPHDELVAHYARYLPLYEPFRRRVLCFEPDPLRVPRGARGKLYTVPDGYVAGIITPHIDSADEIRYARTPYALFRVKRGWDVGRVGLMHPGDQAFRDAAFKFNGSLIAVPMPDYKNCAVVKLFVTGSSGKAIGPERFTGPMDFCGDPESSFQDIRGR